MNHRLSLFRLVAAILVCLAVVPRASAQDLSALARPDMAASAVREAGAGISLALDLSLPVPFRVYTLDGPPRLVADFREVDWGGADPAGLIATERVRAARAGTVRPGWSRLVLDLTGPFAIEAAVMARDPDTGRARLTVRLAPADPDAFAARSRVPEAALWGLPRAETLPPPQRRQDGTRPLRIVVDPGHGGIDPGAERDGLRESELMLTFARELAEALIRLGHEPVLTRDGDHFVALETRIDIARAARADVFLSLHADALADGHATGATVYTLSETASDEASALLAERHDRDALLAGVDLTDQDDEIATVLMELARTETAPRSDRLADALVEGLRASVGRLHKRPRLSAGFSVLKSPDIPSVLVELGFLSSETDRRNLASPDWRARAVSGIAGALEAWAAADAAQAGLLRR
ncbi:N-acetylmuramoyl-L-alanine amidase [Rhodovulum euryhalinum]|uniref:N-acetylmuramoyl-L-alanine amidase n=1 Tax=Rhodovulum euryhalinum TaxID=35805 RepID=A0A4R2KAK7_9RHOB|nr:N-acetylmuramoyl-L-alanine amidase [Rhodovulum euryhalinum]TCO69794.1 N-acetylmuramoyl-L-alanine amidase [Rhodovulum euryhalinum]